MKNPQFSVVIPLYNKGAHIQDTITSVLNQHYACAEIIVIDDGSTDDGATKVKQLNCPKVRLFSQCNQGVSAARNLGIAKAKFSHIAFLDGDDQWTPLYLEEMVKLINKFPCAGVYAGRYQCVVGEDKYQDAKIAIGDLDPTGVLMEDFFAIAGRGDLPFMVSSTVVAREKFASLGGFPVGESMGEDQDFFSRAAIDGPIAYSPNIHLLYHRDTENRACDRHVPEQECGFSTRLHTWVRKTGLASPVTQDILRYCAAHLCHLAKQNIKAGNFTQAKVLLSDYRCDLKPKHKVGLYLWCLAAQLRHSVLPKGVSQQH